MKENNNNYGYSTPKRLEPKVSYSTNITTETKYSNSAEFEENCMCNRCTNYSCPKNRNMTSCSDGGGLSWS